MTQAKALLKECLDELIAGSDTDDFSAEPPAPEVGSHRAAARSGQFSAPLDTRQKPVAVPPYIPNTNALGDLDEMPPLTVPQRLQQSRPRLRLLLPPELQHVKKWLLLFPAYDHRLVEKIFGSYGSNPLHCFHGCSASASVIESALRIVRGAYSQLEVVDGETICTRFCPARLALVARDGKERVDFARRFARLLETPFVEIEGASLTSVAEIAKRCSAVWRANAQVQEREIEVWPMVRLASGSVRVFVPPMAVFLDTLPTDSAAWNLETSALRDQLLSTFADGAMAKEGMFEFDFSRVCFMVGCDSLEAVPHGCRFPFRSFVVGHC